MGTLTESPSTFPFSSGMTIPTAFAAPVEAGTMLLTADLCNKTHLVMTHCSKERGPQTLKIAKDA